MTQKVKCIGALLGKCSVQPIRCDGCWYSDSQGRPTLVKIEVFEEVHKKRETREW